MKKLETSFFALELPKRKRLATCTRTSGRVLLAPRASLIKAELLAVVEFAAGFQEEANLCLQR